MTLENILKKVVQEISRELGHKEIHVKEVFIKYYAGLLTMDPTWGIFKSILHNRYKIQNFVKYVTQKLDHQFDPDIITLKMQLYFTLNCEDRVEMIRKLRAQISSKLVPLQKDILRLKTLGTEDSKSMRNFYKKLIYHMTLQSGMGNPTYDSVFKEVETAFGSVLTEEEVKDFMGLSQNIKKERLNEYTEVVAGIRLYNRYCAKSGIGIENVPKMLRKSLMAMHQELQKLLLIIMQKVNVLTTILDIHYVPRRMKANTYQLFLSNIPEGVTETDVDRIKKLLVMYRQYEIFVRQITTKINEIENQEDSILDKSRRLYDKINETVQYKIAVPAYEIFPMFRKLAKVWYSMQSEALLLGKYNEILVSLSIYTKQVAYPEYERQDWVCEQLLGSQEPQTDAERMRYNSDSTLLVASEDPEFKLVTAQFDSCKNIEFEFLGFCAWKLVATKGGLIPGNPYLGFVENEGKRYIFSTVMAMNMFNTDPKTFVYRALELFRKKPEMIHFLGIHDELMAVRDIEELIPPEAVVAETFAVECQTVDHPVPTNIVSSYKWNVWDLKREALLLANLSHCKTSSTQTEECAGLCPARVQTYELKEQSVQTKEDRGTNVPRPQQYIFGLRGRSDDKQIQVDLTEKQEYSF